jgi:hypothetical protein
MYARGEEMKSGCFQCFETVEIPPKTLPMEFEYKSFEDMQSNFRQIGGWEQKADFETRWKLETLMSDWLERFGCSTGDPDV